MDTYRVRIIKRNNGSRPWRYEWHIWVNETAHQETSYAMTKFGAKLAAHHAAKQFLSRQKRSTNPVIVDDYERKV
jgi:hypothetical protein